jgi:hypothetical protein
VPNIEESERFGSERRIRGAARTEAIPSLGLAERGLPTLSVRSFIGIACGFTMAEGRVTAGARVRGRQREISCAYHRCAQDERFSGATEPLRPLIGRLWVAMRPSATFRVRPQLGCLLALVMVLLGCTREDTGPYEVAIPLSGVVLSPGDELVFTGMSLETPGATSGGKTIHWESSADSVVSLEATQILGVRVRAHSPGRTRITFRIGETSDTATIIVRSDAPSHRWHSFYAGSSHVCGFDAAGEVSCWGKRAHGGLGDGLDRRYVSVPAPLRVRTSQRFVQIAPGFYFTCGRTHQATVFCWGSAEHGTLGNGRTRGMSPYPVHVALPEPVKDISALFTWVCALGQSGRRYCWGSNESGLLGLGLSASTVSTPSSNPAEPLFASVHVGSGHGCALTPTGQAYCWGDNDHGQVGHGSGEPRVELPTPVSGGHHFRAIALGGKHTCAVTIAGSIYCWGDNGVLQLGNSQVRYSSVPLAVESEVTFARISAGSETNCATTDDGVAYCWGSNYDGQLGSDGPMSTCRSNATPFPCSDHPLPVSGGHRFSSVMVRHWAVCGVTFDEQGYCWGFNHGGMLGIGFPSRGANPLPLRIADPID